MANFIKSAKNIDTDFPDDQIAEFAIAGRSNAGKSSIINALANEKIAFSSKTPGCTQLINLYDFSNYRLVDLPGYGYAKTKREKIQEIQDMIANYLSKRHNLFAVFVVCDIRINTNLDVEMIKQIKNKFVNLYVILNKNDLVNKNFFLTKKKWIANFLQIDEDRLIPFSARTKFNVAYLKKLFNILTKKAK